MDDDRALVARCQRGDLAAFEPLVARYRERVWRLAYHVLRDREEAAEAAQEAFIRAWRALGSFRGQAAFYTWLFRIAMNAATDRLRQRAARARALGTEPVPEEDWERTLVDQGEAPDEVARRREARARVERALDALPEHHRAVIMLSDLEGLSYREIAEVLQIPMGTVMSRLHNARKRLRETLGTAALAVALVVLLALAAPATAGAQAMVRFGASVLLASDGPPPVPRGPAVAPAPPPDERLELLVPRLRRLFRYREYTPLDQFRAEVPVGATQRWPVPGERQLEVTPEGVSGSAVRLRVRLSRGSLGEVGTHIQAAPGAPTVIGGPRYGEGVLIIILWTGP